MPQTKARDLQLLQIFGFFMYTGTKDLWWQNNPKESETEFYEHNPMRSTAFGKITAVYGHIGKSGALSVNMDEILAELVD